jgi:BirA family biotin operon repressor/biotin-[acetyl-CoA-carboxylase] ligase
MDSALPGDRARSKLAGTPFSQVEWVYETGSTNTDLLARAAAGHAGGLVRATEHQTAGKGTRGRSWVDSPGAQLMVSVLLRPTVPPSRLGRLTMAWSVAAAEACLEVAGVRVGLKWPNDVYDGTGSRKVAGVLAESQIGPTGSVDAVVIGMGMNVNGGVPQGLAVPGVSLGELAGAAVDREDLLVSLLSHFDPLYRRVEDGEVPARYRQWSGTIGRHVRVEQPDGPLLGVARNITDDGHLVVDDGEDEHTIAAADVVHLRLAES